MRKQIIILSMLLVFMFGISQAEEKSDNFPILKDPYLDQQSPGDFPETFAPGIISSGFNEARCTFSPDGKECFYSVIIEYFETILWTRVENDKWTEPEIAPFTGKYYEGYPSFHPDGTKLYFHSYRPTDGGTEPSENANIWFVERTDSGWNLPQILGPAINGKGSVSGPSVTTDGTLYFSQWQDDGRELAMRSELINGVYQTPKPLPAHINGIHLCISPDESYLIMPKGKNEELIGGGNNYYVSFRNEAGQWSNLIDLGEKIRSTKAGSFATISADGNYFFFQARPRAEFVEYYQKKFNYEFNYSDLQKKLLREPASDRGAIWWVESSFIEELKPDKLK